MEQLTTGSGLTWEQIVIAGVCLAVLLGVCFAALRGAHRGRRPKRMRTLTLEPMSRRTDRDRPRQEPSPAQVKSAEPEQRVEPSLARSAAEGRAAATAPPRGPAPDNVEGRLQEFAQANAEQARTIKMLKSQVDELRQTARASARRVEALEVAVERMRLDAGAARPHAVERSAGTAAPDRRAAERRAPSVRPAPEVAPHEGGGDDAAAPGSRERRDPVLRGERRGR